MANHKFCGECEHELKYCKGCKVPYCVKCSKEWKDVNYTWYSNNALYPYIGKIQTAYENSNTISVGHNHAETQ